MGIFSKKEKTAPQVEERYYPFGGLGFFGMNTFQTSKAMQLSAVYAATNIISNTVAMLPIEVYKFDGDAKIRLFGNQLERLLNLRPDKRFNHFTFIKMIMESVMLRGEAFAYIERDDKLNVTGLVYIDKDNCNPMVQPDGSVKYIVTGMPNAVDAVNMLHFFMHIDTNYRGISILRYAANCLGGVDDAERTANNFFRSGGNLSGIIKASSTLTNDQKRQIQESWTGAFNTDNSKVSVAVLPAGLDYQPISVNPEDAQLLESRKWNIYEIARFFNIPASKLGVTERVSYNSLEQDQLIYMSDCIMPYLEMMENEMNNKLFKPSQVGNLFVDFDQAKMLEADKETQAKYYNSMISNGVLSVNECRRAIGFAPIPKEDGGDEHFIQLSYGTLENIASGAYVKQTPQDQNQNKIDNKVKE